MQKSTLAKLSYVLLAWLLLPYAAAAQRRHFEETFDSPGTSWRADQADVSYQLVNHDRTRRAARSGARGERIEVQAGKGSAIYFRHSVGGARVVDELDLSVWVLATRPGLQVMARVVLPQVIDPATEEPLTIVVPGQRYRDAGLWRVLHVQQIADLLQQQLNVVRARLGRDVDLADAFVESLLVNVYTGQGAVNVWLDDLQVKPYVASPHSEPVRLSSASGPTLRPSDVVLEDDRLLVDRRPTFLRMLRHRGESVTAVKAAGFNALWAPSPDPALMRRSIELKVGVVVSPPPAPTEEPESPDQAGASDWITGEWDAVFLWYLGSQLEAGQIASVSERLAQLRRSDPRSRPVTADVIGPLDRYSSNLDLVGLSRWPLMGASSLLDYRNWLIAQRQLARPGAFLWTWIPTGPTTETASPIPPADASLPPGPFVEPEQLRLMTFAALSAGSRGIGYWSQAPLTGSPDRANREHLLSLALLNLELRLLEPWLATGTPMGTVATDQHEVEAAVIRSTRGIIVLPVWYGNKAEFVPGQSATNALTMIVRGVAAATPAWELTATTVRSLKPKRVSGGIEVTLREFGMTSVVVFTGDRSVLRQLRTEVARTARQAARLRRDLAAAKLRRVTSVQDQLRVLGKEHPEAADLLGRAHKWQQESATWFDRGDYRKADLNARRSMRALRVLQRAQWDAAVAGMLEPTVSPYTLCYTTLPQHYQLMSQLPQGRLGPNLLIGGGFEDVFQVTGGGWRQVKQSRSTVHAEAELSPFEPHDGTYSLRLAVRDNSPETADSRDTPANSPLTVVSSPVSVSAGQLLQISGWVRVPPHTGAPASAILRDSITAAPATLRWWQTDGWQPFTIYRRAPAWGQVELSLALTGAGQVFFDGLAIRPVNLPQRLADDRGTRTALEARTQ